METFDIRTCRERQDAAIEDLQVSVGYAQAATERVEREIAELRKRITALETENRRLRVAHDIFITDCADLKARLRALQDKLDMRDTTVFRLNALLVIKEREADAQAAIIETLRGENAELHEQLHAYVVDGLPY